MSNSLLVSGLFFNGIWFTTVVMQSALLGLLVCFAWLLINQPNKSEFAFTLVIAVLGLAVDGFLTYQGWMNFVDSVWLPAWLFVLWLGFARFSYQWLQHMKLHPLLQLLLFCGAATLNYAAGERLGAASIQWQSLGYTALFLAWWLAFIPICEFFMGRIPWLKSAH
ncbi:MAG: hypothetical protein AseanaTS_15220 [Candidatus Pelagadaptatus aseana]|uniref:DUF2878 family protein n=1 Tax=Candidatus Pelagadaptatus aseana TaxID=3120508 RepID=UPI0039B13071